MEKETALLQQLYRGPRSAKELCEALGISQATLSRLLTSAKNRIVSLGKARSTLYIALREIRGLGNTFPLFVVSDNGEYIRYGDLIAFHPQGYALAKKSESSFQIYKDIPFFLSDSCPQGFLGRSFAERHPNLKLPPRLTDWRQEDYIESLIRRGEDLPGNLLIGRESFERYQEGKSIPPLILSKEKKAQFYITTASTALMASLPGSSAAGEQPKFTLTIKESGKIKYLLVKFSPPVDEAAGQRWGDLLISESTSLKILAEANIPCSEVDIIEKGKRVFLEVNRFDRIEAHGRVGTISLGALDDEWFGSRDNWAQASLRLVKHGALSEPDGKTMRLLYSFGGLIANSDMHFGNISFFWNLGKDQVRLAPVYDMLPMLYAPIQGQLTDQVFKPALPHPDAIDEWREALPLAQKFWKVISTHDKISKEFRAIARKNHELLLALR